MKGPSKRNSRNASRRTPIQQGRSNQGRSNQSGSNQGGSNQGGSKDWTRWVDHSPLPLAVLDNEGTCLAVNPAFRSQLGGNAPLPLSDYFPSAFPVSFELVWAVCRVIGGFRGTLESSHLDSGESVMVELLVWRMDDDHRPSSPYAALLQPVTDRIRQERNRGDWQARYERAVRISGDGILDWDIEHRRAFFSSRFRAILSDATPPAPLNLDIWKQRIAREDRKQVDRVIRQHLTEPTEPFEIEHRVRTGAGTIRHVVLRGQAIVDATGRPYRLICSLRDNSEQRDAEIRTRQLLSDLAHVQRFSTAGELAASIAHELNQPLTAIASFAAAGIRRPTLQTDPNELEELLQKIRKQALRGGEIIRRLRQFLRRDPVPHTPIDIHPLAKEVIELLHLEAQDRQATILTQLKDSPLIALADPIQIQQVMVNLLRNGIEAVADLPIRRRTLRVATDSTAEYLEFFVEDQGNGFDPQILSRVGTNIRSTKKDGLGMGLSLSRSIIESHGGTLLIYPAKAGCKVGFRLPTTNVPIT